MTRRSGNLIYWLASLVAVLAILAAIVWNGWTLNQRQTAQENLKALSPERTELQTAMAEAFAGKRASTENLKRSLTFGGVLVLGGLIVYGLGWAARYASRTPNNNRRE